MHTCSKVICTHPQEKHWLARGGKSLLVIKGVSSTNYDDIGINIGIGSGVQEIL